MMLLREDWELIVAALPVLYGAWKFVIKPAIKGAHRVMKAVGSIESMQTNLKDLQADMKPNGGSSLRDAIDRMERLVTTTNTTQKAVLELIPVGFFLADVSGNCVYVNRHFENITGITRDESLGAGFLQCVAPEERAQVAAEWFSAADDGRIFHEDCNVVNKKTQEVHFVELSSFPMRYTTGEVFGIVGTLQEHYRDTS